MTDWKMRRPESYSRRGETAHWYSVSHYREPTIKDVVKLIVGAGLSVGRKLLQPLVSAVLKMEELTTDDRVVDMETYAELLALISKPMSEMCPVLGLDHFDAFAVKKAALEALCAAAGFKPVFKKYDFPPRSPTPGISATRLLWDLIRTGFLEQPNASDYVCDALWFILINSGLEPPSVFDECGFNATVASEAVVRFVLLRLKETLPMFCKMELVSPLRKCLRAIIVSCCGPRLLDVFGVDVAELEWEIHGTSVPFAPVVWFDIQALLPLAQGVVMREVSFRDIRVPVRSNQTIMTRLAPAPQWNAGAVQENMKVHSVPDQALCSSISWLPALFPGNTLAPFPKGATRIEFDSGEVDTVTAAVFNSVNGATKK